MNKQFDAVQAALAMPDFNESQTRNTASDGAPFVKMPTKETGGFRMKSMPALVLPAILLALPLTVFADPWKDESGHGKGRKHERREHKEEYWDGNCKVERKWKKSGEYKEERKCKGPRNGYYEQEPVYVPARPAAVEPGITIHGTVRIPQ